MNIISILHSLIKRDPEVDTCACVVKGQKAPHHPCISIDITKYNKKKEWGSYTVKAQLSFGESGHIRDVIQFTQRLYHTLHHAQGEGEGWLYHIFVDDCDMSVPAAAPQSRLSLSIFTRKKEDTHEKR